MQSAQSKNSPRRNTGGQLTRQSSRGNVQTKVSRQQSQTSPTTTVTKVVTTRTFTTQMLDQREKDQLQLALKEKEIELEHKLNTLIALNEKLQVFNDLQKDVAEN